MKNFFRNYLTPDEQKILLFLLVFGFLGISLKFWGLKLENKKYLNADSLKTIKNIKIDLLTADKKLLMTVPGIGKKKAEQIIEYRNKYGFSSKKDLMKIKGIGEKTYKKLESYFIDFNNEATKKDTFITHSKKININTATYKDLISIKGIGPKKAKDILNLRKNLGGKFKNLNQLTQIKGIGKKTIEKLEKYLMVK